MFRSIQEFDFLNNLRKWERSAIKINKYNIMGKVRVSKYKHSERVGMLQKIFSAALRLKNRHQIVQFFKELLFDSEVIMLGRRLEVAKMLLDNATYEEIHKKLRVGDSTITAVRYSLENGLGMLRKAILHK